MTSVVAAGRAASRSDDVGDMVCGAPSARGERHNTVSLLNLRTMSTGRSKTSLVPSCSDPMLTSSEAHHTSRSWANSANLAALMRFFVSFQPSKSFCICAEFGAPPATGGWWYIAFVADQLTFVNAC